MTRTGSRRLTRHLLCLLVLFSATQTSLVLADEPRFRFTRTIESPELSQDELLSVTLDAEVYAGTQNQLHDLRITDADEHVVPFLVRKVRMPQEKIVRKSWSPNQMTARPLDDGGLEITVELDEEAPIPEGLKLDTPLDDFEKQVRVETSADGSDWQQTAQTLIFDYSRFIDVRQESIPLPSSPHRHLRIIIDDVTAAQESELLELTRRLGGDDEIEQIERTSIRRRPFRISRIEFYSEVKQPGRSTDTRTTYPAADVRTSQDAQSRQTHILVETRREPLTRLVIDTPDRNFSRPARVQVEEVTGIEQHWRTIGEATLSRIDFQDLQREHLEILFPETRRQRYRIVIDNGETPPIAIDDVIPSGKTYEAVFLANAESTYHLRYGNPQSGPRDADTSTLAELLRKGYTPLTSTLGPPQVAAAGPLPKPDRASAWLRNTPLLIGIIAVLATLLGLALYQAARRIE